MHTETSSSAPTLRGWLAPAAATAVLCSLLATLPHASIRPPVPYKVELLLSIIGLVSGIRLFFKDRWSSATGGLRIGGIGVGIAVFALFGLFSSLWARSVFGAFHHSLLWAVYLCVFLIFAGRVGKDHRVAFAVRLFISITLILGIFAIVDRLSVAEFAFIEGAIRIRYGKYAEMLVTFLPLLWAAASWTKNKRNKLISIAAALLGWLTVMLSLSRGAFIAGFAGMALFFGLLLVFGGKERRGQFLAFAGLWLIFTIGAQASFTFLSGSPSTAEYLSGSVDPSNQNVEMRKFTWQIAYKMFRDNAIFGVGADNFGVNVTEARRAYRLENPENPPTEIAEDYLIERTHNEYLQILAELGIVGFTLFCIPFVIFKLQLLQYLRRRRLSIRPFVAAAISGMSAFAISSLVSSFSFRSVQNGVVFFIVFGLLAHRTAGRNQRSWKIPAFVLPAVIAGSSLLLFAFSIRLAAAEYYVYRAERSDAAGSEPLFQKALYLDADYAGANYLLAGRQAAVGNFESAIDNFSASIDRGIATSDTFVRLAKAQAATGNIEEATKTFEHGLEVYPRSIYLRTAFVVFLEKNGRKDQAEEQARKALSIDGPQARGWLLLFREGGNNAFRAAQKDPGIAEPDELRPASAVPQYLDAIPYQ